jgi:hypothetical protein
MSSNEASEYWSDKGLSPSDLSQAPKRRRGKAVRVQPKSTTNLTTALFHWNELPDYLKDNEFIRTGYRANTGFHGSLKSLFRLHNESGNVWTHLVGALP